MALKQASATPGRQDHIKLVRADLTKMVGTRTAGCQPLQGYDLSIQPPRDRGLSIRAGCRLAHSHHKKNVSADTARAPLTKKFCVAPPAAIKTWCDTFNCWATPALSGPRTALTLAQHRAGSGVTFLCAMAARMQDLCVQIDNEFRSLHRDGASRGALAQYVVNAHKSNAQKIGGYYRRGHLLCEPFLCLAVLGLEESAFDGYARELLSNGAKDPRSTMDVYLGDVLQTQCTSLAAYLLRGRESPARVLETACPQFLMRAINGQKVALVEWLVCHRLYNPELPHILVCLRNMGNMFVRDDKRCTYALVLSRPCDLRIARALFAGGLSRDAVLDGGEYDVAVFRGLVLYGNRGLIELYLTKKTEKASADSARSAIRVSVHTELVRLKHSALLKWLVPKFPLENYNEFLEVFRAVMNMADKIIFDAFFVCYPYVSQPKLVSSRLNENARELFCFRDAPVELEFLEHMEHIGLPPADLVVLAACGKHRVFVRRIAQKHSFVGRTRRWAVIKASKFTKTINSVPKHAALMLMLEVGGMMSRRILDECFYSVYRSAPTRRKMAARAYLIAGGAFSDEDLQKLSADVAQVNSTMCMFWRRSLALPSVCREVVVTFLLCLKRRHFFLPTELVLMILEFCQVKDLFGVLRRE